MRHQINSNLFQPKLEEELPSSILTAHDWKHECSVKYRCVKCQVRVDLDVVIETSKLAGHDFTRVDALQFVFQIADCQVKGLCERTFESSLVEFMARKVISDRKL